MLAKLARITDARTGRVSSWDTEGRNDDRWIVPPGESRVLAEIDGPGALTHLWLTQADGYRDCLLKITWDDAEKPSVLCPLGDFFCLGHGLVASFQSLLFTASANRDNVFEAGCALNCYAPMPFRERARVELVNEGRAPHMQYFYIDYETWPGGLPDDALGYFHAEFRRQNPFGGWGREITVNTFEANIVNKEREAWENNYVILDTRGRGHYIGCNLSVSNFQGTWWGEGDDMIWVDGYKWPPELHGTGSEDYLNQAWGMQDHAYLRNGSSVYEGHTRPRLGNGGGYQTSYVFHLENPVRFQREIKVTIEHGHGNHLRNEMASVGYWYAETPCPAVDVPPVRERRAVLQDNRGNWLPDENSRTPVREVPVNDEMQTMKQYWGRKHPESNLADFVRTWRVSELLPRTGATVADAPCPAPDAEWREVSASVGTAFVDIHKRCGNADGVVYLANRFRLHEDNPWTALLGHDGGVRIFLDGEPVFCEPALLNPAEAGRSAIPLELAAGVHEVVIALDTHAGRGWGVFFQWRPRTPGIALPERVA